MKKMQRGFSLVELMVALGLSLVLLAGALSILYSSKLTYSENERIARVQEAGRTVMELILRDARAAGYIGCARPLGTATFTNGLQNGTGDVRWNFAQPMFGYNANSSNWSPGLDTTIIPNAKTGSDVLVIRGSRQGQPVFRTTTAAPDPTAAFQVDRAANTTVDAGTPMIISDCRNASVFVATSFGPSGTTATIGHGTGTTPGGAANATSSVTHVYQPGAQIVPVETTIYYVRETAGPGGATPALWQRVGGAEPQLIVEGVENIQVTYGVDTTGSMLADSYVTAAGVTNWDNVISMSIAVLVRSEQESGVEKDQRQYQLLGTTFGPYDDRRQRSVFTTTVMLRNRTI